MYGVVDLKETVKIGHFQLVWPLQLRVDLLLHLVQPTCGRPKSDIRPS